MVDEQDQIFGVDQGVFWGLRKEIVDLLQEVLVEHPGGRYQQSHCGFGGAARPPDLLPGAGDAARVAAEHSGPQPSEIDAQLERVGGHHPLHCTAAQPGLDLAALGWQIAAAVAVHCGDRRGDRRGGRRGGAGQCGPHVGEQQFGRQTRTAKDDRLQTCADAASSQLCRLQRGCPPNPFFCVDQGWVEQENMLLPARRAGALDQPHRAFDQLCSQLGWIGDGGAGAEKTGIAAVMAAESAQSAQHIGNVAAEDASIDMHFVQADPAQTRQKPGPLWVVGQNAAVEHIWVGQQQAGLSAHRRARCRQGVAVVGGDGRRQRRRAERSAHARQLRQLGKR